MLNGWLSILPKEKVKILWIRRSFKASVGSFAKRDRGFWSAILRLKLNALVMPRYLKKNDLDYHIVDYNRFYSDFEDEIAKISAFIGMSFPAAHKDQANHHVISGNRFTRRNFTGKFGGMYRDEEWKTILKPWQLRILNWFDH